MPRAFHHTCLTFAAQGAILIAAVAAVAAARGEDYDDAEIRRLPPVVEQTPSEELPPPGQPFLGDAPGADPAATIAPYSPLDFSPESYSYIPGDEENSADATYRSKHPVGVQRTWVEWGRGFYLPGQYPAGGTLFGSTNLTLPHFLVYGDLRTVLASNQSNDIDTNVWATKLQLETDWKITATERFHALFTPLKIGRAHV